jgi:N-succinyldiaminopimelate aminotransferase
LVRNFKRVRDYGGAPPPLPLLAAATGLWRDEAHVEANRDLYRKKFDLADTILGGRFGYFRPGGGFYLWLDVADGEAAALKLWQNAALRVIPGAYLAKTDTAGKNPGAGYIRCALVHDLNTTEQALKRLSSTLQP